MSVVIRTQPDAEGAPPIPSFPVLSFAKGYPPDLVEDRKALSLCAEESFREGLFERMELVDTCGKVFVVVKAEKAGYPKPFYGFSLFSKRVIVVDIEIEYTGRDASVEEIVQRLPTALSKALSQGFDEEFDQETVQHALSGSESLRTVFDRYRRILGRK